MSALEVTVIAAPQPWANAVARAAGKIARAQRPVVVIGSQALLDAARAKQIAEAVTTLGIPVYLSGMARGLLGREHPLQMRQPRDALREADAYCSPVP